MSLRVGGHIYMEHTHSPLPHTISPHFLYYYILYMCVYMCVCVKRGEAKVKSTITTILVL